MTPLYEVWSGCWFDRYPLHVISGDIARTGRHVRLTEAVNWNSDPSDWQRWVMYSRRSRRNEHGLPGFLQRQIFLDTHT